ncbi:MAG: DNA polymerase IV [Polyangiaceae bacterium]|nr:DNA polymerase IV [Polyangiaceae bacterium]
MSARARTIFHVDMDAFYAAIEQRDHPELRGLPVIVGGPRRRGVVSTASYEARRFGVHSAMPMAEAVRRCPQAVVLPVRMGRYADVSRQLMDVLHRYSPLVEPLSLDEAFLDMTGTEGLHGPPRQAAERIKRDVGKQTQLTCSVGIASNKFLAKLASDLDKPDGITEVPRGGERAFIAPLPIKRLWGVGPRTEARLASLGLRTIGELAALDSKWLASSVGEAAAGHLTALARSEDDRAVIPDRDPKSIGSEETLDEDVTGMTAVASLLRCHCELVARRLRAEGLVAGAVRVKVRYGGTFQLATREHRLPEPSDDSRTLQQTATVLLDRMDLRAAIRLVGVAAADLRDARDPVQGDLFAHADAVKHSRLEHTLDSIRGRFGDVIRRADDMQDETVQACRKV